MINARELIAELTWVRERVRNCRGAIESGQVTDKDVRGSLLRVTERLDDIMNQISISASVGNAGGAP